MGLELSPEVAAAVERAADLVLETVERAAATDAAYGPSGAGRCTSSRSPARSSTPPSATPAAAG